MFVCLFFQRLNAAELLRLYIDFDLLEEATHLCLEYIDAVLGRGAEYFGLKVRLHGEFCNSVHRVPAVS